MTSEHELGPSEIRSRVLNACKYAQVGQCVSSVTHDVNNMLGAIMAYAELIGLEEGLSAEAARMITEIVGAVRNASGLVNNLTDIARKQRPDVRVVSPDKLVARVLDLRRYDTKVARINVSASLPEGLGTLTADLPMLQRALMFLIGNAIEAVAEADSRHIRIAVTQSDDAYEFTVSDSAPPIEEGLRARMFEPFFTTKGDPHLGMGLPLAREAAEHHEGQLVYDADRGFVMRLPKANSLSA
ncbi:MAG: HAMP domain-containing histidine kinase [Candidatus Hydrogenedentes bacterium]|nr:HAMP domain-containing histidine kinase [Candidatus Hydrogenedentota bacterium]